MLWSLEEIFLPTLLNSMVTKKMTYHNLLFLARHVMLPRELSKQVPKTHLMSEEEWRRLGVQQSLGWVHYMIHEPGEKLFVAIKFWNLLDHLFVKMGK